tara:strand:+ start:424 stop:681 length:258 start_codon:yes stop_codon:yes gene_type:complete
MSDDSWIDELFDGQPTPITYRQLVTIESNISQTSFTTQMISDIMNGINDLTEEEAEVIITKIYENRYEKDTQKQWNKMYRDGAFD